MIIDLQARERLLRKQETDRLVKAIMSNTPIIPEAPTLDTTPISQSIENTNGINEDQLTMSTLIYEKLDEISSALVQLNENLEKGKDETESTS